MSELERLLEQVDAAVDELVRFHRDRLGQKGAGPTFGPAPE